MTDTVKSEIEKANKNNNIGISLKLLLSSLLVMIVLSVAINAVYVFPFRVILKNTTEKYLSEASGQISHQINLIFEKSLSETQQYAQNIALVYKDTDRSKMIDILYNWYMSNPQYAAVFANFGPGQYDNKDSFYAKDSRFSNGAFATYVSRSHEDSTKIKPVGSNKNYWTAEDFTVPYESQKSYISKPSERQVSQESNEYFLLMRFSSPLIDNGSSVGVLGIDYSMSKIIRLISEYSVSNNSQGFSSLALSDGSIIASKDTTLIHQNIMNLAPNSDDKKMLGDILMQTSGNMTLTTEFRPGEKTVTGLYKFTVGNSDSSFIVMTSIPEDEIFDAINSSTINAIKASFLIFILGILFLHALIRLVVITPIMEQMKTIEKLSITDPLTGLSNRRNFEDRFSREWKVAIRNKKPIAFLMLDADKFKNYNDTYGHPQGDKLLITVSNVLKRGVHRPSDLPGRLGGEEFGILLPNTDLPGAVHIAESLREEIERLRIKVAETGEITTCTVSIGAASIIPATGDSHEKIMKIADEQLYRAKENGRNRVCSELDK